MQFGHDYRAHIAIVSLVSSNNDKGYKSDMLLLVKRPHDIGVILRLSYDSDDNTRQLRNLIISSMVLMREH